MSIKESRFGRLVSHFFTGFLDNDLLTSYDAGMRTALSQVLGLLAVPELFFCVFLFFKYAAIYDAGRDIITWPDKFLFVTFAMILTGFLTVIEWDALFPDQRDYQILMPLPLSTRLIFGAKITSIGLLLVVFWATVNLVPSLAFPSVVLTAADSPISIIRYCSAHAITTFTASAFVFLFFVAIQGVLLNVLPPKWYRRVSVHVQLAGVIGIVLLLFLTLPVVFQIIPWVRDNNPWMYWIPPFWFLALYQELIGRGAPVFSTLALAGIKALAAAAGVSALAYFLSYKRHVARSLESIETGRSGAGPVWRTIETALNRLFLRHPVERAIFHFVRATLSRSRVHRLLLAAYSGVGFALVIAGAAVALRHGPAGRPTPALLCIQLVLSFFILSGMRFAFAIPAELRANWLFQVTEPEKKERCCAGVRKAMLFVAVGPLVVGLFPVHWFLWGWQIAITHLAYGALLSALLIEILLLTFDKIPFTCTYFPGKANLKGLWPVYLTAYWTYAYVMANVEYALLARPSRFAILLATLGILIAAIRWFRKRRFGPGFSFLFEDLPDPAVRTLDIAH